MRLTIAVGGLLIALSGSTMAAQVYKWVDAQGVTHFGAQPPTGQAADKIKTAPTQPSADATPSEPAPVGGGKQQEAIDAKVKQDVAKETEEVKQYCEKLRTDLAHLQNNPRLRVKDKESGEERRLDENERQSRISETEQRIADDCK